MAMTSPAAEEYLFKYLLKDLDLGAPWLAQAKKHTDTEQCEKPTKMYLLRNSPPFIEEKADGDA